MRSNARAPAAHWEIALAPARWREARRTSAELTETASRFDAEVLGAMAGHAAAPSVWRIAIPAGAPRPEASETGNESERRISRRACVCFLQKRVRQPAIGKGRHWTAMPLAPCSQSWAPRRISHASKLSRGPREASGPMA